MHCERVGAACSWHVQLCAAVAAAAAEVETAVVIAATGDSDADAEAVDAAGERTAPVAVETGIGSTQQDVACGRVGPGRRTQGATALAAPSHLMRKKKKEKCDGGGYLRTKTHAYTYTHTHSTSLFFGLIRIDSRHDSLEYISKQRTVVFSIFIIMCLPHNYFKTLKPLWII